MFTKSFTDINTENTCCAIKDLNKLKIMDEMKHYKSGVLKEDSEAALSDQQREADPQLPLSLVLPWVLRGTAG